MTIRRAWTALMLDLTPEEQDVIRARVEREQTTPDAVIVDLVRRGLRDMRHEMFNRHSLGLANEACYCDQCGAKVQHS